MTFPLWLLLGVVAIMIGFAFFDTIQNMISRWDSKEEYGYGYMIPMITVFLIWQRKNQLAEVAFCPSWWGALLVVIGGSLFFLGAIATTHTLSQYALVITLLGAALAFMGWKAFKIVAIPLVVLFFMVPLPPFIYNNLSGKLQLISSELGVAVIRLFGISVYLEGNVIDLGVFKLQVVEACSGLRYLFPLISLAFIAAYFYQVALWKRVFVFLSSIPITVIMNSFRIGVIGVLVEYGGQSQAEGFLHDFEGWIIFMACTAILVLEMTVLAKIGSQKGTLREVFGIDFPEPLPADTQREPRLLLPAHYVFVFLLGGIVMASLYASGREDVIPERKDFSGFPSTFGDWKGKADRLEDIYLRGLKLDDYIIADYVNNDGTGINFYVAYYASQQAGEAAHSPRSCIPGGGWLVKEHKVIEVEKVLVSGKPLSLNSLVIKKGDYTQLVYYWFQQRNRIITNEYMVKWYLFVDALTKNRTDGALVRVTTLVKPNEDLELAEKNLQSFIKDTMPMLGEYIPN